VSLAPPSCASLPERNYLNWDPLAWRVLPLIGTFSLLFDVRVEGKRKRDGRYGTSTVVDCARVAVVSLSPWICYSRGIPWWCKVCRSWTSSNRWWNPYCRTGTGPVSDLVCCWGLGQSGCRSRPISPRPAVSSAILSYCSCVSRILSAASPLCTCNSEFHSRRVTSARNREDPSFGRRWTRAFIGCSLLVDCMSSDSKANLRTELTRQWNRMWSDWRMLTRFMYSERILHHNNVVMCIVW